MRRLLPDPGPTDLASELAGYRPWEESHEDRPWVAVNMITTLDGRISLAGRSKGLGSAADSEHLLGLRTKFDAVMIGAGTMRAERYGRIIARPERRESRKGEGLEPDALAVIISGDLDLPFDAPLFTDGHGRVLIFTHKESAPETRTPVELITADGLLDWRRVMATLRHKHGVRALLCEGGPTILGQLVAAEMVDELFLTITPLITGGDAPRVVEANLPDVSEFELVHLTEAEGDLFTRYRPR